MDCTQITDNTRKYLFSNQIKAWQLYDTSEGIIFFEKQHLAKRLKSQFLILILDRLTQCNANYIWALIAKVTVIWKSYLEKQSAVASTTIQSYKVKIRFFSLELHLICI